MEAKLIIEGIRQFGLAPDGSDLRDLEAAFEELHLRPSAEPRQAEVCPDCQRVKASNADDAAKGLCPKWWAIRDQAAEDDCLRHGGDTPRTLEPKINDAMIGAAFNIFSDRMLMREEDRELIRRMLLAALTAPVHEPTEAEVERGPVPTDECPFRIGQAVHMANPYAGEDPNTIYFVTGIRWEHRFVPDRGWDITIATVDELKKGLGQTDGFAPSDLRAALATLSAGGRDD